MTPAGVLLPYQAEAVSVVESSRVTVWEKSRRIGATWGIAALAVLTSAKSETQGGMDTLYIGFSHALAREFIDAAAEWAKQFLQVAASVDEVMFNDGDKDIQAFRICFASGFEVVALTSKPRSLRGRQGFVIIDEAAFHDDLPGVMKAALALLMWGGRVLVISSHNGVDNEFNQLVVDCRADRKPYKVLRTSFDDAVQQGLFTRVCLRLGQEYSKEAEQAWVDATRADYGDFAGEELDVVPSDSGGRWLARTLLERRAVPVPVPRWLLPDRFVDLPEEDRIQQCNDWLEDNVAPLLVGLSATRSVIGEDFGRSRNLTVIWPLLESVTLERTTPFVVELHNVPFQQQEQILLWLCSRLPHFAGGAFDARGNGQYLAERARQVYGPDLVAEVMLSESWYREHMPPMKAGLEDSTINIPRDAEIVADLRSVELVKGVARVPDKARNTDTGERHGDAAVALALAVFAARTIEGGPLEFATAGSWISNDAFGGGSRSTDYTGFNL